MEGVEIEIFKLLSYGATPEQWAEWLRAPLEHAAARGNFDLVDRLLKAGANGSAGWRGCRGRTLLDAAALGGNGDVVSALLRAGCGPDVNVVSVSSKRSALHLSAVCGHEAVAKKLMMAGANTHRVDPAHQCTPFHTAVTGGHQDMVGLMLIGGASLNPRTRFGRTPLHIAAALGDTDIMSALLSNTGTDFDVLDNDGFSPLMVASQRGHVSAVETLLEADADAYPRSSCVDNPHCAALDLAGRRGHVDVIKAVVKHGVDVNAANSSGMTALHHAARMDQAGSVDALLDAGADAGAKTNIGSTPLYLAASFHSSRAMLALLERGGNVNEPRGDGVTPLHIACCYWRRPGLEKIVDLLLRWGASETSLSVGRITPLQVLAAGTMSFSCSAAEIERVRTLLVRAPEDRVWRRRCWLVMLRSRTEKERMTHSSGSSGTVETKDGNRGVFVDGEDSKSNKVGRTGAGGGASTAIKSGQGAGGSGRLAAAARLRGLGSLVEMLVELEPEGIFRAIVGYL